MNMVPRFSNIDMNREIEKGKAVELQQELWNRLLYCRIQLQKLLLFSNKLPQFGSDATYTENINKGYKATRKLVMDLLDLQASIMNSDPELTMDVSAGDEEIPRDSGDEKDTSKSSVNKKTPRKRKLKDEDCRAILAKRHQSLIPYRNSVSEKWNEKILFNTRRMSQIGVQDQSVEEKLTSDTGIKNYDPEAFDDSDFYSQLLKDFIEFKSTGMDPAILNAQLEIQKMRSKLTKKKYDTKASKGRKIKYKVHPKLLNFMTPAVTPGMMPDAARDELFKSLFGQGKKKYL